MKKRERMKILFFPRVSARLQANTCTQNQLDRCSKANWSLKSLFYSCGILLLQLYRNQDILSKDKLTFISMASRKWAQRYVMPMGVNAQVPQTGTDCADQGKLGHGQAVVPLQHCSSHLFFVLPGPIVTMPLSHHTSTQTRLRDMEEGVLAAQGHSSTPCRHSILTTTLSKVGLQTWNMGSIAFMVREDYR